MNSSEIPQKPRSFRVLKAAQCVTIPIGALTCLIIFSLGVRNLAREGAGSDIDAVMGFYWIVAALVAVALLALQVMSLFKMFKLKHTFLFWTKLYGFTSLASKIILFVIGMITVGIIKSMANAEWGKQDFFTQSLVGDAYRAEVDKVVLSLIFMIIIYLVLAALYPVFVLLLAFRKSMKEYAEKLSSGLRGEN